MRPHLAPRKNQHLASQSFRPMHGLPLLARNTATRIRKKKNRTRKNPAPRVPILVGAFEKWGGGARKNASQSTRYAIPNARVCRAPAGYIRAFLPGVGTVARRSEKRGRRGVVWESSAERWQVAAAALSARSSLVSGLIFRASDRNVSGVFDIQMDLSG